MKRMLLIFKTLYDEYTQIFKIEIKRAKHGIFNDEGDNYSCSAFFFFFF